jgi:hypothetical protein
MIKNLIKYGTHFCAVEHSDSTQFFFLQLKRKQKELVGSQKGAVSDFESLIQKIQGQKHVYLIVNDEQVLTKSVSTIKATEERLVKMAFPNISLSDFYYEVYSNDQQSFVSISRKDYVHTLIDQYEAHKISVIDFSLGALLMNTLIPYIDEESIVTSNTQLYIENDVIANIKKEAISPKKYIVNELEVSNKHLLSLAGIISYYTGKNSEKSTPKELQKEYFQKRFFNLGFKFALGFLFISLLINFLVFSNYQSKETVYKAELMVNKAKKVELTNLKDLVLRKKKLMESITSSADSKVAWYLNEISASVPTTISLKSMSYQPIERTIKEGRKVLFKEKVIEVSGISIYDKEFTKWIANLEKKEWIDEVSIVHYGVGKKTKTSFDFNITLNE